MLACGREVGASFGKGSFMAESQSQAGEQRPVMSTIAGSVMIVIILALSLVIWDQRNDLEEAVQTLAVVTAKCVKK